MAAGIGHDAHMTDPGRPLDSDELAILDFLLQADVPGAAQRREQVAGARVVGGCDCPCPSVELEAPAAAPPAPLPDGLYPVEAEVVPVGDESAVGVMLFIERGRLSALEYYWYDNVPTAWPRLEELRRVGG
jgi:hypothetical protein